METYSSLCTFQLLPSAQPKRCAPELGLRQHALKTASQALCPLEHSESALELISDGMNFVSKELKVVSFYVFVFMA